MPERPKHLLLSIELPSVHTADIDLESDLREEFGASDSEFILNWIGEPGVVRVRMEISGEKDSDIVEVWGSVREAALVEPSRGYVSAEAHLTEEQLAERGWKLMRDEAPLISDWRQVDAKPARDLMAALEDSLAHCGACGHVVGWHDAPRRACARRDCTCVGFVSSAKDVRVDTEPSEPDELPAHLNALLEDAGVVIPRDTDVWELIGKWQNAPRATESGPSATSEGERHDR